jgi:glutamine amidotransferase
MKNLVSLFNPAVSNIGSFERFLANNNIDSVYVEVGDSVDTSTLIICGVSGLSIADSCYFEKLKYWIRNLLDRKIKVIGICAGMQMLFSYTDESSEEMLGLINGKVNKLDFSPLLTNTYIGNRKLVIPGTMSLSNAYFSHGYGITEFNTSDFTNFLTVELTGGQSFLVYFEKDNLIGFQFHPERSSEEWRNFLISKIK